MTALKKIGIGIGALLAVSVLYNVDAIMGAIKFKRLCKTEGGARVYEKIEKNMGWMVEDNSKFGYKPVFSYKPAFVRYKNEHGEKFDVIKINPPPKTGEPYKLIPAEESKPVRYLFKFVDIKNYEGDERFSKTQDQVIDLHTEKIVATYTNFGFAWTTPDRVILAAPTGVGCFDANARQSFDDFIGGLFKESEK